MWIVYDDNDGLVGTFDSKKEAYDYYEKYKEHLFASHSGEFYGDELVVVAKIDKQIKSTNTDEHGWIFKEEKY